MDTVGLALGGGAALGAAHVGVLRALHDLHIEPTVLAGTSAGALVGAGYAAGLPHDYIEQEVRRASFATFARAKPSLRLGVMDTVALEHTIRSYGFDVDIESLPTKFGAVAVDLRTRREVILDHGSIATALRASIAVPGLFPPIIERGSVLVDGGVASNLPVTAAGAMGASLIVSVRLLDDWDVLPIVPLSHRVSLDEEGEVLGVRPSVAAFSRWSNKDVPALIEIGYQAAMTTLLASAFLPRLQNSRSGPLGPAVSQS